MIILGQAPESIRPDGLNLTARIEGGDAFGMGLGTSFSSFRENTRSLKKSRPAYMWAG